ncbi:reverse transcriptase domain-containing protein [Trichonephila inaurata madagascariensis]|uniref:Reverse transcriptase domain-containing protein n=1 Tax=Trichonephila inaurata madagascariensis TaxID=2747483 RepID=A0A8X6YVP7_9ARAC|nr:reverse transcriptase domain-containing protein [Trichonephila inaurata madagascariensis]
MGSVCGARGGEELEKILMIIIYINNLSEPFITERGLCQGDSLVHLQFNIGLGKCLRNRRLDRRSWLQLLSDADDIDIIGRPEKAVKEIFSALESAATKWVSLSMR